jgi:predicted molibdopterin-dependent oxidoreductase YjgC
MAESVSIRINGRSVSVPAGITVAVALAAVGQSVTRHSVSGQSRGPVCGMGVCFECRVTIDGQSHQRSCQTLCREGMEVRTDG